MPLFIQYLLKLSISLALVYLFYQLLLRRLTFYNFNRWYLLGYSLLSFFIPFINIESFTQQNNFDNAQLIRYIPVIENYTTSSINNIQQPTLPVSTINGWQIFYVVLIAGSLIMLLRLLMQFFSLQKIKRKSTVINDGETFIYHVDENIIPFSFGNSIYVNQYLHSEKELQEIILHEYVHVKQNHTGDIFFAELLCIINWYNPFAWLIRHAIRQNLEFIADNHVLQNGLDKKSYQYHLLKVVGLPQYRIANSFNFSSLKKRIAMMNKIKTAKVHLLRFLFLMPLLAVLLLAFRDKYKGIFKNQTVINDVGIIIDINSKQPIAGVSVADTISGVTAVTDERGFYSMKIPVKKDTGIIYLTFNRTGYANDFSENTFSIPKMRSHGRIELVTLIPTTPKGDLKPTWIRFGFSIEKFPDEPTYVDALKQLQKAKHRDEDWNLFFKLQNDHPEVSMFYMSEYKTANIVIFKNGSVEKYGYPGGATIQDMEKKYGQLPEVMTKNELPVPSGYLAKWKNISENAEKNFHTTNPDVYEIIFPGDSRAIAVPKNGKPQIYDMDNNVPEERPAFEKLYGSLDRIVPPATNFVNGAHNDDRYKDWRISGIEFIGFNKIDFDRSNSLTHFIGQGVLKINSAAKALIIYNNKEYDPDSFKQQFGNAKFGDVFIYENEGAFNKFGEKGKHGVIVINSNSVSSFNINSQNNLIDKKDTVPSSAAQNHISFALHRDDEMDNEHKEFFKRNKNIQLLHWTATNELEIYHVNGKIETVNLNNNNDVQKAVSKYGKLPDFAESYKDQGGVLIPYFNKGNSIVLGRKFEDPLYIIDGQLCDSPEFALKKLNPDSIVNISVLKDSAAISRFGERGKNGVIIIKTKKYVSDSGVDKKDKAGLLVPNLNKINTIFLNGKKLVDPLYVIDGKQSDSSELKKLNRDSVYFVSVLGDSAAISRFGEKGKNGAIIIQTKKYVSDSDNNKKDKIYSNHQALLKADTIVYDKLS